MNVTVNLSVVAIVVATAVAAYFLVRAITQFTRAAGRVTEEAAKLTAEVAGARDEANELRSLLVQATSALEKTSTTAATLAGELETNLVALPKILEGILKVCDLQFEVYKRLNVGVQKPVVRTPNPVQDTDSANLEWEIQQRMREGVSRAQAEMEMNSANDASVWGGFDMGGQL